MDFNNPSNIGEDTWGTITVLCINLLTPTSTSGLASAMNVFGTCLKFDGVDDYIDWEI